LREIAAHDDDYVGSLAFAPDGRAVLSGGFVDGTAKLWNVSTGALIRTFKEDGISEIGPVASRAMGAASSPGRETASDFGMSPAASSSTASGPAPAKFNPLLSRRTAAPR
jgi:WD40 repeat protein